MSARLTFVKSARKSYKEAGIKKGESYYWWKFRFGGKHMSKERPKNSQLENSPFRSGLMAVEEIFDGAFTNLTDLESAVDQAKDDLQSLSDEAQSSFDNMPEGLQQGDTGQMLENRVSEIDSLIGDLDSLDFSPDDEDDGKEDGIVSDKEQEQVQALIDDIQGFGWSID